MLSTLFRSVRGHILPQRAGDAPAHAIGEPPVDEPAVDEQAAFFEANGYLILPGFFSPELVARARLFFDELWQGRTARPDTVIDAYFSLPEARRIRLRRAAEDVRAHPYKVLDLHLEEGLIRELCTEPRLLAVLRRLLGANPLVCNTLLFERGSQQEPHFDTFFMPSKTPNKMAASWIAFDDVSESNGPLFYYPKSHLVEPYRFSNGQITAVIAELASGAMPHIERVIRDHGLRREIFTPKAGDVLIWHAQLLHGGSPIRDPAATRRSLVTHYWTELDHPSEAERIDCGDGRWLLKRSQQCVEDEESYEEVERFLATLPPPSDDEREAVPASFDPRRYLVRNQDILRAGVSPWRHYAEHGAREGRIW